MDLNYGLFQTIVWSYAVFNRLGNTERSLAAKLEIKKKILADLETTKNIAAVAQAKWDEIVEHEKITLEENKRLNSENACFLQETESLKARVSDLIEDLKEAESKAIENFKKTVDFQELIMPVFLEGFEHTRKKIVTTLLDFDASVLEPGEEEEEEPEPEGEAVEVEGPGTATEHAKGKPIEVGQEDLNDSDHAGNAT